MNIAGLDKARILKALYNGSHVQGMGVLQARQAPLTVEDCRDLLKQHTYFDYLYGRVLKVDLKPEVVELRTDLYDRDNGKGAAERVILEEFNRLA
jgi:hypothetical protein